MSRMIIIGLLALALAGCGYSEEDKLQGKHCEYNTYAFEQALEQQYGADFDLDHHFSYVGQRAHHPIVEWGHQVEMPFEVGVRRGLALGEVSNEDCRSVSSIDLIWG